MRNQTTSEQLKVGAIVKYSNPQADETDLRFVVLEDSKGKVDIQWICDWAVKPIETVAREDVCLA